MKNNLVNNIVSIILVALGVLFAFLWIAILTNSKPLFPPQGVLETFIQLVCNTWSIVCAIVLIIAGLSKYK